MHQEKQIFLRSIQDFFSKKMLQFALLPIIVTSAIMYILFFSFAGIGIEEISSFAFTSPPENTNIDAGTFNSFLESSSFIKFLLSHSITSWIASFLVYTVGGFLVLYLSIFIAINIVGMMTPYILKELHKKHYNHLKLQQHSNSIESTFLVFKWSLTMMFLFFALLPLYFIPVINIIAFNFPLYYFFHKMLNYDIASNICTRKETKEIRSKNNYALRTKTLAMYLLSLIPFSVFLTSVFYVIYIGNTYFYHLENLQISQKKEV